MPDTQKKYLIGRDVAISIIPATVAAATGLVTYGTSSAMTGQVDDASVEWRATTEEISGTDGLIDNWEKLRNGWELQLTGIKLRNADALQDLAMGFDHAQVIIVTPYKTFSFVGVIENYGFRHGRGKHTSPFTLKPIDIGTPNPVVTATV